LKPINIYKYSVIILVILFSIFTISCKTTAAAETTVAVETIPSEARAVPTTTESPLVKKVEIYSEAMEKYRSMSIDSFETLPLDERLLYSQYIIDNTLSTDGYNNTYGEGKNGQEFAVGYTPVSQDNNGQEIVNNNLYIDQISYLQWEFIDGDKPYDASDGIKCLSSVYYEIDNKYISNKAQKETLTTIAYLSSKYTATNTSDLLDGIDSSGDKIQYKTVEFYTDEAITYYARFVYHEFTNYDGTRQAIWLLENMKSTP
jgi:hypothetical protein